MSPETRAQLLAAFRLARPMRPVALAEFLYTRWFTCWRPPNPPVRPEPPLVARMRAAHAATERYESGWIASQLRDGHVLAVCNAESVWAAPGDFANLLRPAAPARRGDSLALTLRRDRADSSDGWWYTWNARREPPASRLVRLYWNCGPGAAPALVHGLTTVLESSGPPYLLKCPVTYRYFGRTDAVVLYLEPSGWEEFKSSLSEVHALLESRLESETPPLTLRLGRGVSAAEDPDDGTSFGQSRCAAVSNGILQALASGRGNEDEVLAHLEAGLLESGIDPGRPYLRPGGSLQPW